MGRHSPDVTVGIITALDVEFAAVRTVLDMAEPLTVHGDPATFAIGTMPSADPGRPHGVVVAAPRTAGARSAVLLSTTMSRSFPRLRCVVLCGLAAAVPGDDRSDPAVRLGDVVTATQGVVDYAPALSKDRQDRPLRSTKGLSPALLRADYRIQQQELDGHDALHDLLAGPVVFARPSPGRPLVHRGAIGSADRLVRDARTLETIAAKYGLQAIEMEGSGLHSSASLHGPDWYMVRGISDSADNIKRDRWQPYAAAAAAAYTRALLQACAPFPAAGPQPVNLGALGNVVDTLLQLPVMHDDYQRRAVMAALPVEIRSAISETVTTRLQVVSMVHTCMQFEDGMDALGDALRLIAGEDSPQLRQAATAIGAVRSHRSDQNRHGEPPA